MKIVNYIKGFISYVTAIAFATVFALFCSGRVGWFIVLTLVLAPLFSFVLLLAVAGRVVLRCEVDELLLEKGGVCHLKVFVDNLGIFPVSNIKIELLDEVRLAPQMHTYGESLDSSLAVGGSTVGAFALCNDLEQVSGSSLAVGASVLGRSTAEIEISYRGRICGPAVLGVKSARIYDVLGIFSMKVKKEKMNPHVVDVAVLPDVADFGQDNETLKKVAAASRDADDSEDSVETSGSSVNGFPGYEHRDYAPGDPPKKVNWKMSAKRGKLLVRMDDEVASSTVSIVLDSKFGEKADELHFAESSQLVIENALGLAQSLLMNGYTVNFHYLYGGLWECHEILDDRGLVALKDSLARYEFAREDKNLHSDTASENISSRRHSDTASENISSRRHSDTASENVSSMRLPDWLVDGSACVSVVFTPVEDVELATLLEKTAGPDGKVTVWAAL